MALTLEEWHATVTPHLDMIECGARMALRHARALPVMPPLETNAEAALRDCEAILTTALASVQAALAALDSKEIDR